MRGIRVELVIIAAIYHCFSKTDIGKGGFNEFTGSRREIDTTYEIDFIEAPMEGLRVQIEIIVAIFE